MVVALSSFANPAAPVAAALIGLAAWMSMAVSNNIIDRGTNIHLLGVMFRMELLREDPALGRDFSTVPELRPHS